MGRASLRLSGLVFASWLSGMGFAQGGTWSEQSSKDWSYADQASWSSIPGSHCGDNDSSMGWYQSPIDIPQRIANADVSNVTLEKLPEGVRLGPVTWVVTETTTNVTLVKGPTTWTVETFPPFTERIRFENDWYNLVSITFKSPSEHAIGGVRADLEVQLNHLSQTVFANGNRRLVEAIRFNAARQVKQHNWLNSLWRVAMTHNLSVPPSLQIGNPFTEVMPPDRTFVTYTGSTTEPPCYPAEWIVHVQPNMMSYEELIMFRSSLTLNHRNRLGTNSENLSTSTDYGYGSNNRDIQNTSSLIRMYQMTNSPVSAGPSSLNVEMEYPHAWWRAPLLWLLSIAAFVCMIYVCCAFLHKLRERYIGDGDEDSEDYDRGAQKGLMMQPMTPQFNMMPQFKPPPVAPYGAFPEAYTANTELPRGGYGYADQTRFS